MIYNQQFDTVAMYGEQYLAIRYFVKSKATRFKLGMMIPDAIRQNVESSVTFNFISLPNYEKNRNLLLYCLHKNKDDNIHKSKAQEIIQKKEILTNKQ